MILMFNENLDPKSDVVPVGQNLAFVYTINIICRLSSKAIIFETFLFKKLWANFVRNYIVSLS